MKNTNNEYFLTIIEEGSLSKAAQKLYLSQPSLSQYVKRMEKRLGVELFDHNSSPLKLTYSGERYYEFLLEEQKNEKEILQELKDIKLGNSGRIRLGIAFWRAACFLLKYIRSLIDNILISKLIYSKEKALIFKKNF